MAKHHYYTFKVLTPQVEPTSMDFQVECTKWDEFNEDIPEESYKISPANRTAVGGCSCPAWKWDCKHVKCVNEAIADGKIHSLWQWKWTEKKGWEPLDDFDPSQAMTDFVS